MSDDLLSGTSSKLLTEKLSSHGLNISKSFLEAEISSNQDPENLNVKHGEANGQENHLPQELGYSVSELTVESDDNKEQNNENSVYDDGIATDREGKKMESKEEANNLEEKDEKAPVLEDIHTNQLNDEMKEAEDKGDVASNGLSTNDMHAKRQNTKEELESDKNVSQIKEDDEWLDILGSGQLKKKVLRKAENSYRPQRSHICVINVEGELENGTIVEKAEKLTVQIGDAEVVQGLDLTLPLMDIGELALVQVGPRFAYGNLGHQPDIPANATIMYKVELLSAEPEPEMETLSVEQRKEIGCRKRERGNWWYSRQEHTLAIQCYRRALEYLDDVEGGVKLESKNETKEDSDELHSLLEERLKVYNNLGLAQLKIKAYDTALQSVGHVLRCQPNNVKALFRKGKILAAKGDNAAAMENLRLANKLQPESQMIKQELMRILSLHKEDTRHEKNLYKKMLGQDKTAESTKNSKFHIPWGILFGTVAAMVAGAVAIRYRFM